MVDGEDKLKKEELRESPEGKIRSLGISGVLGRRRRGRGCARRRPAATGLWRGENPPSWDYGAARDVFFVFL